MDDTRQTPELKRALGLPLLVLYGTGITIGAGIYVLIGAVAHHAGTFAPLSFVLAALVMALTVASYAELATRYPVSAGEAVYVRAAFDSRTLSIFVGVLTIAIGIISSSAVALGCAGYIRQFVDLPPNVIVIIVVVFLGLVAAWGILESVLLAGLFTLIEVGGLVAIVVAAINAKTPVAPVLFQTPPFELAALSGIAFGSLLAFFAFIGFEDLANIVEESANPRRDIPRAMIWTLIISTILYVAVAAIAVAAVPLQELSASSAPLSLVFQKLAGVSPVTISAIAIFATLNTILAQMTMAARVMYGMARQGDLPGIFGRVNPTTSTPVISTFVNVALIVVLAVAIPFEALAEGTSIATLGVFALVNLALLWLRYRGVESGKPHVRTPVWMPAAGFVTCLAMIVSSLFG